MAQSQPAVRRSIWLIGGLIGFAILGVVIWYLVSQQLLPSQQVLPQLTDTDTEVQAGRLASVENNTVQVTDSRTGDNQVWTLDSELVIQTWDTSQADFVKQDRSSLAPGLYVIATVVDGIDTNHVYELTVVEETKGSIE